MARCPPILTFRNMDVIRAVSLDFYGTLVEVDSDRPSMAQLLTDMGYACSDELEAVWNSHGFDGHQTPAGSKYHHWRYENLRNLVKAVGASTGKEIDELVKMLLDNDSAWTVRARSGAHRLLEVLDQRDISYVICTNWDYELKPYLAQAGLPTKSPYVTSAQVGARKPAAAIFQACLSLLGESAASCLHVGDSWAADVVGALRMGISAGYVAPTDITLPAGFGDGLVIAPSLDQLIDTIIPNLI